MLNESAPLCFYKSFDCKNIGIDICIYVTCAHISFYSFGSEKLSELNHIKILYVQCYSFFFPLLSSGAGGMKEQDLMCIKLHGVNRIGLKKIIDFIYTAKLSLNMENLQDTLEAASFLQILPVLDFCKVFLISGVRKYSQSCVFTATLQFLS